MLKKIISISALIIVASCSSIEKVNIAPGYIEAYKAIKNSIFGYENEIDLTYIDSIPYASMIVRIGNGPSGLMILESVINGKYTWVSADGVYIIIKEGMIIQSQGLPNNLDDTISSFKGWKSFSEEEDYIKYSAFEKPELKNLKTISNFRELGTETTDLEIRILDLKIIEEEFTAPQVGWNGVNKFWIDEDNFVWKSKQSISPRLPVIYYTVTKKPR